MKRVSNAGTIRLKSKLLFIANALKQHHVGLEEVDEGIWSLYFCSVLLGRIDERDYVIRTFTETKSVAYVAGIFCYLSSRLLIPSHGFASSRARLAPRAASKTSA